MSSRYRFLHALPFAAFVALAGAGAGGAIASERGADEASAAAVRTAVPVAPADAAAAIAAADPPQVLDVRSAEEFAQGHVPTAMLIPHDELAARLGELDRDRPILLYCRSGRRADLAEKVLVEHGFDVRQIEGSWLRWEAEALPVEGAPTPAGDDDATEQGDGE